MRGKVSLILLLALILFSTNCETSFAEIEPEQLARLACNAIVKGRVDEFIRTVEFFDDVRPPFEAISERRGMEKVVREINSTIGVSGECVPVSSFPEGKYLTLFFQSADDEYWNMTNCEYYKFKARLGGSISFIVIPVCAYGKYVVRGFQIGFKDPTPDIIKKISRINKDAPIFISGYMDY